MFCTRCGKEIVGNEKFCTRCGNKLEFNNSVQLKPTGYQNAAFSSLKSNTFNIVIVICALMVINGILILTPTFNVGLWGFGKDLNVFELIKVETLKVVAIMMYLFSTVLIILPKITKKKPRILNIFPALITNALTVILFVVVLALGRASVGAYGVGFSMLLAGWLILILSLCSIVLIAVLIKKTKNIISSK